MQYNGSAQSELSQTQWRTCWSSSAHADVPLWGVGFWASQYHIVHWNSLYAPCLYVLAVLMFAHVNYKQTALVEALTSRICLTLFRISTLQQHASILTLRSSWRSRWRHLAICATCSNAPHIAKQLVRICMAGALRSGQAPLFIPLFQHSTNLRLGVHKLWQGS